MSSHLARQCGIAVEVVDLPAYGPDGTTLTVHGMARVPLTFGSVNISIRAIVVDLATPKLYLGDDFVLHTRALLDYNNQSVALRIGRDSHTSHLGNYDISRFLGKPLSLYAMMASYGLKAYQAILCAIVLEKPDSNGADIADLPQALQDFLAEFSYRSHRSSKSFLQQTFYLLPQSLAF
jgi:hypothetical protein